MNFSRFTPKYFPFFLLPILLLCKNTIAYNHIQAPFNQIVLPEFSGKSLHGLLVDQTNLLFMATDNSVFITDGVFNQKIAVPGIPKMCRNGNGLIAIGGRDFLMILSMSRLGGYFTKTIVDSTSGIKIGNISTLGFDGTNLLFSNGPILWQYDGKNISVVDSSYNGLTIYNSLKKVYYSKSDSLLFGIVNGKKHKIKLKILKSSEILGIADYGDTLLLATKNFPWLYKVISDKVLPVNIKNNKLRKSDSFQFSRICNSSVYFKTQSGLLAVLNKNGEFENLLSETDFFALNQVIDIQTVDNKTIYAITPSQAWRFLNPGLFVPFQTLPGKDLTLRKSVNLNSKNLDAAGLTYTGDTIYSMNSLYCQGYISFVTLNRLVNPNKIVPLFAIQSNLQISSVFLDRDSNLFVTTPTGGTNIGSCLIKKNAQNSFPNLRIFSIKALTKKEKRLMIDGFLGLPIDSTINIENGNSLKVEISGVDPLYWNNLSFSAKLEGYDTSWSEWTNSNSLYLIDLKPGVYKLLIKSKNPVGVKTIKHLLTIKVVPAFYQTEFALISFFILVLLIVYATLRWRSYYHAKDKFMLENLISKRTDELVKEKEKTENLLARVLPRETANELKETGKVNTQRFMVVTVLFSDIQGFTRITDETNPEVLIDQLDKFFLYFDTVVEKYKIEKIKTIGDAYMCAGGLPKKNRTNPVEVVLAAFEMMFFMKELNRQHKLGFDLWDLRIGIDTGPVIAGVVGRKKLTYDIWGTTVNTASRMESSGEIGKINISGNTYLFVKDYFECTYRGKMPIKNKGDIEMYFVESIKPELSENFEGIKPNREFEIQLQILRLGDLEEFILDKLDKGLPKNLYYHNLKHTVDVYTQVELIGRSENVTKEELLLLRTAALFHDSGHMIDYDTHEEMGVKLAREILPEYQYTERQIEIISELIMATKMPPRPKNLTEAIMCDADLDYLGRTDFIPVSNLLYKELHEHGKIGALHEWNELQMKFIEKHQYFTNTARKLRNVNKKSQLENIKAWIEKNNL